MRTVDLVIIGGGPAGLSAAISAKENGIEDLLIIERSTTLGGILNQCIHNGFGLHVFKEELTGPEYAGRLIQKVQELKVPCMLNAMVLNLTNSKQLTVLTTNGVETIQANAVILAMGCREKPRGAINIPGERCAGIFSAGTAQEMVNLRGYDIGKEVVILGSGDIGLIMARRLTFEGAKVKCVAELMPYSSGLKRNIVQCLDDYNIPLKYNSTITNIYGKERVEGVTIAQIDQNRNPIPSTEEYIPCDTILLSVGLIPENELSKSAFVSLSPITNGAVVDHHLETSVDGIFACGNVLHVHDLVDNVTLEAYNAAASAAEYLKEKQSATKNLKPIVAQKAVRYTVPSYVDLNNIQDNLEIKFRSDNVYKKAVISVYFDDKVVFSRKARVVTPGEMESITLKKELFETGENIDKIAVEIGS